MKLSNYLVVLILLLQLTLAQQQGSYFGAGLEFIYVGETFLGPLPSFQIGNIAGNLELRGSLTTFLVINQLSGDVLFTDRLPEEGSRYYLGGGVDIVIITIPDVVGLGALGVHATAGLEFSFSNSGAFFLEAQPVLFLTGLTPGIRARTGVNFYF